MSQKNQKKAAPAAEKATAPVAAASKTEEKTAAAPQAPVANAAAKAEDEKKAAEQKAAAEKTAAEAKAKADKEAEEAAAKKKQETQTKKAAVQKTAAKKKLTLLESIEVAFAARKKAFAKQMSVAQMEQQAKEFTKLVRQIHVSKSDECYEALLAYITGNATQVNNVIKVMNDQRCSVAERDSVAMMMAAMTRIASSRRNEEPVSLNVAAIRKDCQYQQLANFLTSKNDG